MSALDLSYKFPISPHTVQGILHRNQFWKLKATWKPMLSPAIRAAWLQFAMEHKDKTLEDWKNVIWTDETGVILDHRRGGTQLWRTPEKRYHKTCIQCHWKGVTEFMFWGTFSYDKKGPCHIWTSKTAQKKRVAEAELEEMNATWKEEC